MLKNSLEKVKKAASNLKHGKSIKPFKITRNAYAKIKRSENPYSSLYNLSVVDGTGYLIHQKDLFLNDIPKAIKEVINKNELHFFIIESVTRLIIAIHKKPLLFIYGKEIGDDNIILFISRFYCQNNRLHNFTFNY